LIIIEFIYIEFLSQTLLSKIVKIGFTLIFIILLIFYIEFDFINKLSLRTFGIICLISLITSILYEVIRALKMRIILKENMSKIDLIKINIISYFYIITTPGGLGDVSRGILWKKKSSENKSLKFYSLILIFERILTILIPSIISLYTFNLLFSVIDTFYIIPILIVFTFIVFFSVYFIANFISKKMRYEIKYNKLDILKLFFIEITLLCLISYQVYLVLMIFGIRINFHYILASLSLSNIIAIIPISLGGFGIRELSFSYILISILGQFNLIETTSILLFTIFFNQIVLAIIGMWLNLKSI